MPRIVKSRKSRTVLARIRNLHSDISGFIRKKGEIPRIGHQPRPMNRKIALITGATSGIGKAFAHEFARQGYDLIITGRRRALIEMTAEQLHAFYGVQVRVIIADLRNVADVNRLLAVIENEDRIEALVNNAGYGLTRLFHDDTLQSQMEMLDVHVNAPIMFIHKVLPGMISRNRGIIINVSSLAAYMPTHTNVMYSSSKAFFINFSESLTMELKRYDGIKIQCLCPGYTRTDFHKRRQITELGIKSRILGLEPSKVVKYSFKCLRKGRVVCIPGFMNRVIMYLLPLLPRPVYYRIARRLQHDPVKIPETAPVQNSSGTFS
jgi:short-subunit dehydrogenase